MDRRVIGGRGGRVGGLPPGTRALRSHPHEHAIVPGGRLADDGRWLSSRHDFLGHVKPLSVLFRAKGYAHLPKTRLWPLVEAHVWPQDWGVHCAPVGSGQAAFRELAPYIVRGALRHNRILRRADGNVTLPDKASATAQTRYGTVRAEECIRRFLQPVLPDRFVKVRSYGLLRPGNRQLRTQARERRGASTTAHNPREQAPQGRQRLEVQAPVDTPRYPLGGPPLSLVQTLRPQGRWPPCPCWSGLHCALPWGSGHLSCVAARAGCALGVHKRPRQWGSRRPPGPIPGVSSRGEASCPAQACVPEVHGRVPMLLERPVLTLPS
jgi:hypothetical protein